MIEKVERLIGVRLPLPKRLGGMSWIRENSLIIFDQPPRL